MRFRRRPISGALVRALAVWLALSASLVWCFADAAHGQGDRSRTDTAEERPADGAPVEPTVVRPGRPTLEDRGLADYGGEGGRREIGREIGDVVNDWSTAVFFGVALLVGLGALAKRELGQTMVLLLVVVFVGGFVFAESAVRDVIVNLADGLDPGGAR